MTDFSQVTDHKSQLTDRPHLVRMAFSQITGLINRGLMVIQSDGNIGRRSHRGEQWQWGEKKAYVGHPGPHQPAEIFAGAQPPAVTTANAGATPPAAPELSTSAPEEEGAAQAGEGRAQVPHQLEFLMFIEPGCRQPGNDHNPKIEYCTMSISQQ